METRPTGTLSEVVEIGQPSECVNGHELRPPNVLVGWHPCSCHPGASGHRTFRCKTCTAEIYLPPHDLPAVAYRG